MLFNFPINFNELLIKGIMISSRLRLLNKASFQLKFSYFIKPNVRFNVQSIGNLCFFSQIVQHPWKIGNRSLQRDTNKSISQSKTVSTVGIFLKPEDCFQKTWFSKVNFAWPNCSKGRGGQEIQSYFSGVEISLNHFHKACRSLFSAIISKNDRKSGLE